MKTITYKKLQAEIEAGKIELTCDIFGSSVKYANVAFVKVTGITTGRNGISVNRITTGLATFQLTGTPTAFFGGLQ